MIHSKLTQYDILFFLIMKIIKTKLQNKIEDNFLIDCLNVYIKKKVARKLSTNSIIDKLSFINEHKAQFTFKKRDWNFKVC